MKTVIWFALASVLGAAACSQAAPTGVTTATLSASVANLTLERTATTAVQATLDRGGAPTDVTAVAAWTTSNSQVVTVAAGVVTAVGPGTATIVAEHEGRSVTVPVLVRRRVYMRVHINASADQESAMHSYVAYFNGQQSSRAAQSGWDRKLWIVVGSASPTGVPLVLGDNEFAVQLDNLPGMYVFEFRTPGRGNEAPPAGGALPTLGGQVRDYDTDELLGEIVFPLRTEVLPANARVTWRFTVKAYTS